MARITAYLEGRFGLVALWLFGSEARGTVTPESDVDLAALFRTAPSAVDLLEARMELAAQLSRDVDLVDLDRASPILVMQVLRKGKLLVDKDSARRLQLAAKAPGRYEDLLIVRREAEQALIGRVRGARS
jgi:predicted nucleotidyltransferase